METAIQRANRIKEEHGLESVEFKNSFYPVNKIESSDSTDSTVIKYISKPTLDRDSEIVISQGIDLKDFLKSPQVLFAHNYHTLPIGIDQWIKYDGKGLLAKQKYNMVTSLSKEIFKMHDTGFPLASSIGFIPTKTIWRGSFKDSEWTKEVARLAEAYSVDKKNFRDVRFVYENCVLLEHSDVPVPANPDALTLAIKSGKIAFKSEELNQVFESVFLHNQIGDLEVIVNRLQSDQKILEATINTFTKDMVTSPDGKSKISQDYINSKVALAVDKFLNKKLGKM